jgi:hypothetical protein
MVLSRSNIQLPKKKKNADAQACRRPNKGLLGLEMLAHPANAAPQVNTCPTQLLVTMCIQIASTLDIHQTELVVHVLGRQYGTTVQPLGVQ